MNLGEKILKLRKKNGFSQENLADKVDVTRQTISNWELGETSPNPSQLKLLSKSLNVSIDELLDNEEFVNKEETKKVQKSFGIEYVSKKKIKGIPLVHINLGFGMKKAKGIIAIGNIANGIISLGMLSTGIISFGVLSIGLLSFGSFALGLLLAIGGLSLGTIAIGGVTVGIFAIGGVAIGLYSLGGVACAKYIAAGDHAYGYIAIGRHVKGTVEILENSMSPSEIKNVILQHFPNTWDLIINMFSNVSFKHLK